jgi:hypothetical protein
VAHMASDLAVTLPEDRPGALAKAITAIGEAGINLEGYAELEGLVHVLTIDVAGTRRALQNAGFQVIREKQVVLAPVDDAPGSAARIFERIADAGVNIRFSYLATGNRLVIGADDLSRTVKALDREA